MNINNLNSNNFKPIEEQVWKWRNHKHNNFSNVGLGHEAVFGLGCVFSNYDCQDWLWILSAYEGLRDPD